MTTIEKERRTTLKITRILFFPMCLWLFALLYLLKMRENDINCPLFKRFGLYCFGCGGTRALRALSSGNISGAFFHNPVLIVLMPVAGYAALCFLLYLINGSCKPLWFPKLSAKQFLLLATLLILCIVAITVLRNCIP